MSYIPLCPRPPLSHYLVTLINSLCAAVECFGINKEDCFPPIKVIEGKEDIVVKMSDEGGGIPRSGCSLDMYITMTP